MEEGQTCPRDCFWLNGSNSGAARYIQMGLTGLKVALTTRSGSNMREAGLFQEGRGRGLFGVVGLRRTQSSQGLPYVKCNKVKPLLKKMSISYINIIQDSMK